VVLILVFCGLSSVQGVDESVSKCLGRNGRGDMELRGYGDCMTYSAILNITNTDEEEVSMCLSKVYHSAGVPDEAVIKYVFGDCALTLKTINGFIRFDDEDERAIAFFPIRFDLRRDGIRVFESHQRFPRKKLKCEPFFDVDYGKFVMFGQSMSVKNNVTLVFDKDVMVEMIDEKPTTTTTTPEPTTTTTAAPTKPAVPTPKIVEKEDTPVVPSTKTDHTVPDDENSPDGGNSADGGNGIGSPKPKGLKPAVIAGCGIGGLLLLVIIIVIVAFVIRKQKNKKRKRRREETEGESHFAESSQSKSVVPSPVTVKSNT